MANENVKVLHTRMRQKRVEASQWETAKTRTPLDGELIIYKGSWKGSTSTTSIFVGDGTTKLSLLNPIGTYNHNKSELSWDETVTVGHVGADAITVSLPKPTFAATNGTGYKGQPVVSLEFTAGKTPQTIDICNPSNTSGIWYDSDNGTINMDAPPTSHASENDTYGKSTSTEYGHVKLKKLEDCSDYTDDESALTPLAVKNAITGNISTLFATGSQSGVVKLGYTASGKNYAIQKSANNDLFVNVPWTDTHYESKNITTSSADSTTQTKTALTNGNVYLNEIENGVVRSSHKISGSGYTVVKTDASGNIDIYTSVAAATSDSYGLVKLGYITSGKNYKVQKDPSGNLYVNVPWTDNNTTYSYATQYTAGLVRVWVSGNTLYLCNTSAS